MFRISFLINNISNRISGFDLGHIRIFSDNTMISSSGRTPDQSIMVFITIIDMLDGLNSFFKDKKAKEYKIICADSSFTILFIRKQEGKVDIKVGESAILKLDEKLLAKEVYYSCNSFFCECKAKMIEDDPVIEDIEVALEEYKKNL